jgi:hypothetical protein
MKEDKTDLRWQNQLITYVARRTEYLASQSDSKKVSVAEKYEYISRAIDSGGVVVTLPEDEWVVGKKPLDLLRAYNPETLTWERIDFLLMGILNETFGIYKEQDILTLAQNIFHRVRSIPTRRTPRVYRGSRYILFSNGIFDAKTRELIPIDIETQNLPIEGADGAIYNPDVDESYVTVLRPQSRSLEISTTAEDDTDADTITKPIPFIGFTEKHKHHFDLDLTVTNPSFAGYGDSDTWTPEDWLTRTSNNDQDQADFLAKILGVMLVPNHSFNAFIEINGESSGGKTTLINLVNAIYGHNPGVSTGYTLDDLSDRFPFRGTVNRDTAFVHITETNGARLNSSGISLVNSFANQEMQMKQMGTESLTLTPPPLLVLEGKGWVLFDSTKTGIARRLLPIDIRGAQTARYRNKRYGKLIFENKTVLAYFAKRAVLAYADLTQGDDNYMFNLDDITTMPEFVQAWHINAVNAGDEQMQSYSERMQDVLTDGFISSDLLYDLYKESVLFDDPDTKFIRHRRSFEEAFTVYLREFFEFEKVKDLMRVTNTHELAINFNKLTDVMPTPDSLKSYAKSADAMYKSRKWYKVTKLPDKDKTTN